MSEPNKWSSSWRHNFKNVLITFTVIVVAFVILYYLDIFVVDKDHPKYKSKIDILISLSFALGLIGALWAILARIDAERAFKQAELTYKSFADSFEFDEIFGENKLPAFIEKINQKDIALTFFLGFPCVGIFWPDKEFQAKSFETFELLINKLQEVNSSREPTFKISLACFSKVKTLKFIENQQQLSKNKLPGSEAARLNLEINEFYEAIRIMGLERGSEFVLFDYEIDLGIRFIVESSTTNPKKISSIEWVVADFKEDNPQNFKSAGFRTVDENFSQTLIKTFNNFKEIKNQLLEK